MFCEQLGALGSDAMNALARMCRFGVPEKRHIVVFTASVGYNRPGR